MNTKSIIILTTVGLGAVSCGTQKETEKKTAETNPLLADWNTPYQVPPFHLIQNSHFEPAILKGLDDQVVEIETITANPEEATFENTIVALENSGKDLKRVSSVFYNLTSANTNQELQDLSKKLAPTMSKHNDKIYMNDDLFERVETVWNNKGQREYTSEEAVLLERTYNAFVRNGAKLNAADRAKLSEINSKLSLLSLQYGSNLLKEVNGYKLEVTNVNDLKGLSPELIEEARLTGIANNKPGTYIFTLQNPSVIPFLQFADNRELRKEIWTAFQNKGNNNNEFDNKKIAIEIANLRLEKAKILGYDSHAAYALENTMAKNATNVNNLLNELWTPALTKAGEELKDIQELAAKDGIKTVEPWDWRYYTEKIRKAKYDLSEEELKPYFSIESVRQGIFNVTNNLFGLTYKENKNIPVYHKDATAWEVYEKNGDLVGILYMDFHPRIKTQRCLDDIIPRAIH
nr:M3 family metallopeptidase [Flavobacterium agricola]